MIIYTKLSGFNTKGLKKQGQIFISEIINRLQKIDPYFKKAFKNYCSQIVVTRNLTNHFDVVLYPLWLNVFLYVRVKVFWNTLTDVYDGRFYISTHNRHLHYAKGSSIQGIEVLEINHVDVFPITKNRTYKTLPKIYYKIGKIILHDDLYITIDNKNNTFIGNILLLIYNFDQSLKTNPELGATFLYVALKLKTTWQFFSDYRKSKYIPFNFKNVRSRPFSMVTKVVLTVVGIVIGGLILLDRKKEQGDTYPINYRLHTRED